MTSVSKTAGKMISLLAKIPYFRKQILRYALRHKKPKGFDNMTFAFKDTDGRGYYTFTGDFDVYVKRRGYWEQRLIELDAGLSKKEKDLIIGACKDALNKKQPNYALVAHLIQEMDMRNEWLVHHDIMYDLLAACYVREDEDPAKIDEEIHKQKLAYFMGSEDVSFFFDNQTLSELLPYLANLKGKLKLYLKDTEIRVKALQEQIVRYTSEAES